MISFLCRLISRMFATLLARPRQEPRGHAAIILFVIRDSNE